jgi:hypothetical protein
MSSNATVVVGTPYTRVTDPAGLHRLAVDARFSMTGSVTDINGSADPFGRLRSSQPTSLFDSKQIYDNQPLLFSEFTANGGSTSYVQAKSCTTLNAGLAVDGRSLRQTRRYFNYQPGKGQLIFTTFNLNGGVANVNKKVGYFDDNNGIFLKLSGSSVSLVKRSNVSGVVFDDEVPQALWEVDTLLGDGPSKQTLDLTKVQILVVDMQWLGVGAVRVGFSIGQTIVYVHKFEQANIGTTVYMQTPNLPVRWEVQNSGIPGGATSIDAICCSVQSEGGFNPLCVQRTSSRGAAGGDANTSPLSMISMRLKSSFNRATVFPLNSSCVTNDTGIDYFGQLILNPVFASPLTFAPVANSPVEISTTQVSVSNGTVISEFYGISGAPGKSGSASITTTSDLNSVLALASDYAGTQDIVTLAVRTLSGTTTGSMFAGIDWLELL